MIVINKSGYLKYKNLELKCTLGKAGVGIKKREGDNITPKGTYKILNIYYRKDRIKKISSKLKLIAITKQMGWCDDPDSKYYNKLIKLPTEYSHERFFRKDNVYDLVLALNYNMKPIIKNKGSAIFIHISRQNYKKTSGCVAIKKPHLIKLIKTIKKKTKVVIN
jgi:L,D-peptidoglycan transpeptidase YkuD (ErfK/YbiS/YcfS/YnhG family)